MDNDPEPVKEQKKEKPLNELLTSSIVDIYIGPESTHWPLHERLLCYHSPFFSNVFYKEYDKSNQDNQHKSSNRRNKSYGFPDEEDYTFTLLVGWLYSNNVPIPKTEKDIGPLLDLYLLAEKLEISRLSSDVVDATRDYYHDSSTYPGLRRVQYIYANTDEDNEMREMMVSCVARQLATTEKIPQHWATALQRNGQLAVDIIRSIQRWNIEERSIPDVRDSSIAGGRGRKGKSGFSAIVRENDSLETETTGVTGSLSLGSNLGVESVTSEEIHADANDETSHGSVRSVSEADKQGRSDGNEGGQAEYLTLSSLTFLQAQLKRLPAANLDDNTDFHTYTYTSDIKHQPVPESNLQTPHPNDRTYTSEEKERMSNMPNTNLENTTSKFFKPITPTRRRNSVTFNPTPEIMPPSPSYHHYHLDSDSSSNSSVEENNTPTPSTPPIVTPTAVSSSPHILDDQVQQRRAADLHSRTTGSLPRPHRMSQTTRDDNRRDVVTQYIRFMFQKREALLLLVLWGVYLGWVVNAWWVST